MPNSHESSLEELLNRTPEGETTERLTIRAGSAEHPLHGQDRMYFDREKSLFVVCDGVGSSENAGETAQAVVDAFSANYYLKAMDEVGDLNRASAEMARGFAFAQAKINATLGPNAGSTTTAAVKFFKHKDQLHLVAGNAGDSRIMLWRNGTMSDITEEQNDPEHPSVVTNWLGKDSKNHQAYDEIVVLPVVGGDKIVVCSDGVTGDKKDERLTDEDFTQALSTDDPQMAAEQLVELSKKSDDKTVIVVGVEEGVVPEVYPSKRASIGEKTARQARRMAAFMAGLAIAGKARTRFAEGRSNLKRHATNARQRVAVGVTSGETYQRMQRRVDERFGTTKDRLMMIYLNTENRIVSLNKPETLTEEQLRHRRWALNGAIGVLALWGAYKLFHGLESGGNNSNYSHPTPSSPTTPEIPQVPEPPQPPLTPEVHHVPHRLSLHESGSTIWGSIDDAAGNRGLHLTDAQTYDLVSKTLAHNHLSWEDARHLPVGYRFTIPEEVRRLLEEQAEKK